MKLLVFMLGATLFQLAELFYWLAEFFARCVVALRPKGTR